jgi:hypothetical protein
MTTDQFWGLTQAGWAAVAACVAAATLVGAVVTVIVAFKQFAAVRAAHVDQTRPYVVVDFEPSLATWIIADLVVKNMGQGSAKNFRLSIDPAPQRAMDRGRENRLSEVRLLNEPVPTLPPGREYRLLFDNMIDRFKTSLPMVYTAKVYYESYDGKEWEDTYILDLAVMKNAQQATVYGLHDAAKALDGIKKSLESFSKQPGPMQVVVEERAAYGRRLAEEYEQMRAEDDETAAEGESKPHEAPPVPHEPLRSEEDS